MKIEKYFEANSLINNTISPTYKAIQAKLYTLAFEVKLNLSDHITIYSHLRHDHGMVSTRGESICLEV